MPKLSMEEFWAEAERSRKLIERYAVRAFRLNPADAEDLASDTIARAAYFEKKEGLSGFNGDSQLSTYLIRVAFRIHLSHVRKKETKAIIGSLDDPENTIHQAVVPPEQHEIISASIADAKIRAAIEGLPRQQKLALEYRLNDYSSIETAEELRISTGTLKSNRSRAMTRLRNENPELRELLPSQRHPSKKISGAQASL